MKNKNNDTNIASAVEAKWNKFGIMKKLLAHLSAEERLELLKMEKAFASLSSEQRLEIIKDLSDEARFELMETLSGRDRADLSELWTLYHKDLVSQFEENRYKEQKELWKKETEDWKEAFEIQSKSEKIQAFPQSVIKLPRAALPAQEVVLMEKGFKVLTRDEKGNFKINLIDFENMSDLEKNVANLRLLKADLLLLENRLASVVEGGYVKDIKLSTFPILREYLANYVESKSLGALPAEGLKILSKQKRLDIIDGDLSINERRILMNWLFRLLNLNLYTLTLELLTELKDYSVDEAILQDLLLDIGSLLKVYYGRINPSIREAMRQRSITITKNIYCGFDTEYDNIDMKTNRILSAQWAVNSKVLLTIPDIKSYSLSNLNTHSGEEYALNSMWYDQKKISFATMEGEIVGFLGTIRNLKGYASNDLALINLKRRLIKSGLPYFISKGKVTFSFERSAIKTYFKTTDLDKLDMERLVSIGQNLGSSDVDQMEKEVRCLLKEYNIEPVEAEVLPDTNFTNLKAVSTATTDVEKSLAEELISKSWNSEKSGNKLWRGESEKPINMFIRRNFNLIGHLTQADLSLLSGFEELKNNFDIINKNLVTLGGTKLKYNGYKLSLYDTMLLAPGGKKSLAAVGAIYGFEKLDLSQEQYDNMSKLLKENPVLFKEYAVRDAVISLIHALTLEDAHFRLNKASIPLTLSLLGGANLRKAWEDKGYTGYQISKEVMIGDSRKNSTPKGLFHLGETGLVLNDYISNYKGGRNESFMIGKDNGKTTWYDYDLTAAYASAMCMLGNPNYDLLRHLTPSEVEDMSDKELIYSYTVLKVNFEFPENTAYPSIPCYADESTTIYPLKGKAQLTGSEYILARSQNCKLKILGGTLIPYTYKSRDAWKEILDSTNDIRLRSRIEKLLSKPLIEVGKKEEEEEEKSSWESYKSRAFPPRDLFNKNNFTSLYMDLPFYEVISELQTERNKHPKGTIENLLYKEMGNSLYGSVAKGISNKMRYDIKMNKTIRMEAGSVSNPIMASYITASVRALIGIFLQLVALSGGKAVSVTTDGLISDQEALETKFQTTVENLESEAESSPIYKAFSEVRSELSGKSALLELKHKGKNLTSWTTRGQISSGMDGLKAATGLQTHGLDLLEVESLIKDGISSERKTVSFVSTSLRSIKDIVQKGGHVTMTYRDQDFRLHYNNNRSVVGLDPSTGFYKTKPWLTIEEALSARLKGNILKGGQFQIMTSLKSTSKYTTLLELGIRNFVKYVFTSGLYEQAFKNYTALLNFIKEFMVGSGLEFNSMITSAYISEIRLKILGKVLAPNRFILTKENRMFYDYVVKYYPQYKSVLSTRYLQSRL